MSPRRLIIAAGDACKTETTNQVEHLLALLGGTGHPVEVALVGDGERLRVLRRHADVVVADRFRTRGLGGAARVLGLTRLAGRYKSWRVRRWANRAMDAVWVVVDPRACSFLRHADRPPSTLVGVMLPGDRYKAVDPKDRVLLDTAALWLAATADQIAELREAVDAPVHFVGDLQDPRPGDLLPRDHHRFPRPGDDDARPADPIVLSGRSHLWEEVSHAPELIWALHRRRPDLPIVWLADAGEDEWLARHDLGRLGLPPDAPVRVMRRDGPMPPVRPRIVVRTSYGATDPDLALASALEQIPTIGFDLGDLPAAAGPATPPFAVEALADQVIELLDDEHRARIGERLRDAVQHRHNTRRRLRPLFELVGLPTPEP